MIKPCSKCGSRAIGEFMQSDITGRYLVRIKCTNLECNRCSKVVENIDPREAIWKAMIYWENPDQDDVKMSVSYS